MIFPPKLECLKEKSRDQSWRSHVSPTWHSRTLSPVRKHSKISGNKQLWQNLKMLCLLIGMMLPILSQAVEVHEVILSMLHPSLIFQPCSSEKEAIIVNVLSSFPTFILCHHYQVSSYMPDNETTVELRLTLKSRLDFASNINNITTITITVIW